jgi:hypothetical protein
MYKKLHHLTKLGLALLSLSAFNSNAHVSKCLQHDRNEVYNDFAISYIHANVGGSGGKCIGNSQYESQSSAPFWRQGSKIRGTMVNLRASMNTRLLETVTAGVTEAVAGKYRIKSVSASIFGPIKVSIKGQPGSNGKVNLTIGGFGLNSKVRVEKNWYAKGTLTLSASNLQFTGQYDVNSGQVTLTPVYNNIDVGVNLSSPIPFFSLLLDLLEGDMEANLNEFIIGALTPTTANFNMSLFGLDAEIPEGAFVFDAKDYTDYIYDQYMDLNKYVEQPDGRYDLGELIKEQLRDYVNKVDLSITQYGDSPADNYVSINIQGFRLTTGRRFYKSKFSGCPRCQPE